jgi:hypothetical protein
LVWLALGIAVLLLLLWLGRLFATARVETVRKVGTWSLAALGGVLLLLLLWSGRGAQALWTLIFLGPVIWRLAQSWRLARRFGRRGGEGSAAAAGDETSVETATLVMRLDHATGRMSGRVRRGPHAARELAELTLPALLGLLADCRAADPESVPLLEAWLDRAAPDWREAEAFAGTDAGAGQGAGQGGGQGAGQGAARSSGPMSRADALAVLGLSEGATPEEIRAAHRRLMRAAHPDQGGSDWLAARINQARDVLLG